MDSTQFDKDGYIVIKDLLTEEMCDALRIRSKKLIDDLNMDEHPKTVFSTQHQKNDEYFMESQDKVRFFFEEPVFDDQGKLNRPKDKAVNKIGHGLHYVEDLYKEATHLPAVQKSVKALGFTEPIVIQSMVIFKQPEIGGVVTPHQDGTFLMTKPSKVIGIWIALEDADIENGCLWFIPGSHKEPTPRKMIRNPDPNGPTTIFTTPADEYDASKFVAVPIKKGDAIVIHGHVVHKSEKNNSLRSREIYTFHVAESEKTEWCGENWLQPSNDYSFPKLFTE